jgi:hypothetical protein
VISTAPMVELGRELTAHAPDALEAQPAPTPSSPSSTCANWGVVARKQRWSHGNVSRHRQQDLVYHSPPSRFVCASNVHAHLLMRIGYGLV